LKDSIKYLVSSIKIGRIMLLEKNTPNNRASKLSGCWIGEMSYY